MKKQLARVRRELAEEEARGVGKGGSEAEDFLKFFLGIQRDGFGPRRRASGTFPGKGSCRTKALLLIRNPDRDLAWVRIRRIERAQSRESLRRRGRCDSGCGEPQKISSRTMSRHSVFLAATRAEV